VGLSTLERDALDVRLEIHVVLDYADTKLTPSSGRRPQGDGAPSNFIEALAPRGRPHPRRSGHGRCGGAGRARSRPPARPSPPAPPGTPPPAVGSGSRPPRSARPWRGRSRSRPRRSSSPPTTAATIRAATDAVCHWCGRHATNVDDSSPRPRRHRRPVQPRRRLRPVQPRARRLRRPGGPPDHWRAPSARPLGRREKTVVRSRRLRHPGADARLRVRTASWTVSSRRSDGGLHRRGPAGLSSTPLVVPAGSRSMPDRPCGDTKTATSLGAACAPLGGAAAITLSG
jgi:hypothetical protein